MIKIQEERNVQETDVDQDQMGQDKDAMKTIVRTAVQDTVRVEDVVRAKVEKIKEDEQDDERSLYF